MTKFKLFSTKNTLLFNNFIANFTGVTIVLFLSQRVVATPSLEMVQLGNRINMFFIPCAFIIPLVLTLLYEEPIRRYLNFTYRGDGVSTELTGKARRRLLNEPFFLIAVDFGIWVIASVIYPLIFWAFNAGSARIQSAFFLNFYSGLITITIAFFVFEHMLQRKVAPIFFPDGGLYMTPRTLRIRIRIRLIALLFACNLVPFFAIINMTRGILQGGRSPVQAVEQLQSTILINALLFMGVGIWLTILVSGNLRRPLEEIIRVLQGVRNGLFNSRVRVTSNDEIGYTGDVINEMNEGLKERDLIKDTFGKYVAKEVRDEVLSGNIPLDGEKKDVTILFSDLRNFTPMTESNDPKLVIKIMNSYFKEMAEAIQDEGGLVLQFIGDEIYAVFGAPIFRPDHATRALRAGLEMKRRLETLNKQFEEKGWPNLRHGIGIHTGDALAANIGSPDRLSYLLVGDTVNLASRLQSLTKEVGTEMIVSSATHDRLAGTELSGAEFCRLPPTRVKGKAHPVEVYTLN
ncbi:adenylate/guanylate cyclase domain-containing protein [Thermodesulfobacteriota bacterium]